MQLFIILLIAGVLLICAEIFAPGGILGAFGTVALIGAIIIGFAEFGSSGGFAVMVLIILFLAIVIWLWLKFFPNTKMGRALTLVSDSKGFRSTSSNYTDLVGKTGTAHTDLRPAGSAVIDGRRLDVVTEGALITTGAPIRVIKTEGNRIVVRELPPPDNQDIKGKTTEPGK